MTQNDLSQSLSDLGFFPAMDTMEVWHNNHVPVGSGPRCSCEEENDIFVVYDEKGYPWVALSGSEKVDAILSEYGDQLKRDGVHVPHSHDGGWFASHFLTQLSNV